MRIILLRTYSVSGSKQGPPSVKLIAQNPSWSGSHGVNPLREESQLHACGGSDPERSIAG